MIKLVYGKRHVDVPIPTDVGNARYEFKRNLKLQVPAKLLYLSKQPSSTSQKIRRPMTAEDERSFFRELRTGETVYVSVVPFDTGNYHCTGEEIGSGAFSQVYKGYHKETKEAVAIKVIDTSTLDSPKAKEYHEQEKAIIQTLDHECIVKLYDLQEEDERGIKYFFFITEFCEGGSLDQYIKGKNLPEAVARRLLKQLVKALQYLESRKIVHRDLKPQNILLSSRSLEKATIKLADFGFSRYYSPEVLIASHPGTPLYESPEILFNRLYNENKSDLWSLGVIFYEMLAGHPLFHSIRTLPELKGAVQQSQKDIVKFPSEIKLSKDCMDLLHQLLEKDVAKRINIDGLIKHSFFAEGNQLMITCVPTGFIYNVEITEDTNVQSLKTALASHNQIPPEDQLLIVDTGIELTNEVLLLSYKPIWESKHSLYLFNSKAVRDNATISSIPITFEPESDLVVLSEDMPIKNLLVFKHQFTNIQKQQQGYYNASLKAYKKYEETMKNLWSQIKGMNAAIEHLNITHKELENPYKFISSATHTQDARAQKVLQLFDRSLQLMRETNLHESISSSRYKTLLDCYNEPQLRKKFEIFKETNDDIRNWLEKVRQLTVHLARKPDTSEYLSSYKAFNSGKEKLKTYLSDMKSALDTAQQNITRADLEVEKAKRAQKRVDVSDCFEAMLEVSTEKLSNTKQRENEVNTFTVQVVTLQQMATNQIASILDVKRKADEFIQSVPNKLQRIIEHRKLLEELEVILQVPEKYKYYITEMIRRANFQKIFMKRAQLASDMFAKLIMEEISRLHLFNHSIGNVLPSNLFPLISVEDQAPCIDISLPPKLILSQADKFRTSDISSIAPNNNEEDFTVLISDYHDFNDIRTENEKMRLESLSSSKSKDDINYLEEIASLQQQIQSLKAKQEQFFEDYEKRFNNSQQRLKEAEEREKALISKLQSQNGVSQSVGDELVKLREQLRQTEDKLQEATSFKSRVESDMTTLHRTIDKLQVEKSTSSKLVIELQVKIQQLEMERESLKKDIQSKEKLISFKDAMIEQLKRTSDDQRKQSEHKIKELENQLHLSAEELQLLSSRATSLDLFMHQQQTELHWKEQFELSQKLTEKLLKQTKQAVCPLCQNLFPSNEIEKHAVSCQGK